MKRSTDRILTSHGGNLPRPPDLDALIADRANNRDAIAARLPSAVTEVVELQIDCGIDILNDGEYVKAANGASYGSYTESRVTGWETLPIDATVAPKRAGTAERDRRNFPGVYESGLWYSGSGRPIRPGFSTPGAPPPATTEKVATGPVAYIGHDAIAEDVRELKGRPGRPGRAGRAGRRAGFHRGAGPAEPGRPGP